MRSIICVLLFLCALSSRLDAQMRASNQHVTAIIDPNNQGLVTIRIAPGTNLDPILSYPQKSFVAVTIGEQIFTNNHTGTNIDSDPRFGGFLDNGVTQKFGDTIRTTWPNKNGCDIIQDVYPVDLGATGQVVMRWKLKNKTATPIDGQVQFLLDVQVGKQNPNDGTPVLTRMSYWPRWEKFDGARKEDMPPYFAIFENRSNNNIVEPGIMGVGYNEGLNYRLGLRKPSFMVIGDWGSPLGTSLVDLLWGVSATAPFGSAYTDAAILYQWDYVSVESGRTSELGSTSYGTAEMEQCAGEINVILFYPHLLSEVLNAEIAVDAYLFTKFDFLNPLAFDDVSAVLHAGPNVRITSPDTGNIGQKIQRQLTGPSDGDLNSQIVGTASWKIVVDTNDCTSITQSWLKLTTEGKHFVDEDTCEYPVQIDCDHLPHADVQFIVAKEDNLFDLLGNPSLGKTFLQTTLHKPTVIGVYIVDVTGRPVGKAATSSYMSGLISIPLDTRALPEGTYYVIAELDGRQFAQKLQIVR